MGMRYWEGISRQYLPGLRLVNGRAAGPRKRPPRISIHDFHDRIRQMGHSHPPSTILMSLETAAKLDHMFNHWEEYEAKFRRKAWEAKRRRKRQIGRSRW